MAQPIYLDPELQSLEREKQLALALQQRGMKPAEGQMVGNRYVAPAWTQNLANLYDVYSGAQRVTEAEKKIAAEQARQQQLAQENLFNAMKVAKGTAGTPDVIPQGQTLRDDQGQLTYGAQAGTAPVAANKEKAMAMLLRPNATPFEQNMASELAKQQFKEPSWKEATEFDPKTGNKYTIIYDSNSPTPELTKRVVSISSPALSASDIINFGYEGKPIPPSMNYLANQGGGGVPTQANYPTISATSPILAKPDNSVPMPAGLTLKQQQEWRAKQAEPLTGVAADRVTGAGTYQEALNNYYNAIKDLSPSDMANPQTRAKINEKYETVKLTGKNAHSLGVLNGGDERILSNLVPNYNNPLGFKDTIKATVEGQKAFAKSVVAETYATHQKPVPANLRQKFGFDEEPAKPNKPINKSSTTNQVPSRPPAGIDITTWNFMTPEEKALWR